MGGIVGSSVISDAPLAHEGQLRCGMEESHCRRLIKMRGVFRTINGG
jgi:hypothetical protein